MTLHRARTALAVFDREPVSRLRRSSNASILRDQILECARMAIRLPQCVAFVHTTSTTLEMVPYACSTISSYLGFRADRRAQCDCAVTRAKAERAQCNITVYPRSTIDSACTISNRRHRAKRRHQRMPANRSTTKTRNTRRQRLKPRQRLRHPSLV